MQQCQRVNAREEDEMIRRHAADRKRLPGILKREMQTRQQMFKQHLRISMINAQGDDEKERIKQVNLAIRVCICLMFLYTSNVP